MADRTGGGEDAETLRKMTVSELKALLTARGVSFNDCFEKEDLVSRALETGGIGQPTKPDSSSGQHELPFKVVERRENLGGLETIVIENHPQPDALVVICHGFGANNEDLSPIGHEALGALGNEQKLRFLFPNAPLSLGGISRAWWHIDLPRLMSLMMQGPAGIERATRDVPEGLNAAREALARLIQQAREKDASRPIPMSRVVVGGFSQGSMLSTDYTLHCGGHLPATFPEHQHYPADLPGGLVVFSGTIIHADRWKEYAATLKARKGPGAMHVVQTHGRQDPLLPFPLAQQLRGIFENIAGFSTVFEEFNGGHTIPPAALRRFVQLLRSLR